LCSGPVVLHIAPCQAFDKLLTGINDIVENRIESNLRTVSKVLIVNFSNSGSFTPETFVRDNTPSVAASTALLQVLFGRAHVHCIGPRYPTGPFALCVILFGRCVHHAQPVARSRRLRRKDTPMPI
jgi:hypothetical protein